MCVYIPDWIEVLRWLAFLGPSLLFQANCRGLRAFHEDGQHTVVANVGDTREEARDPADNGSYRGPRRGSTVGTWGLMRQYLDLQEHRR